MRRIRKATGIVGIICLVASFMVLTFAADAGAQQGECMMMDRCGMCCKCQNTKPMKGDKEHGAVHPSGASLMKMLHKWGKLFFAEKERLGLSDEQLDAIESILMSHVKSTIPKKADLKVLLIESREALVQEDINLKAVEKKLKAMEALNTEMAVEGIQTLKKALAVLTPEQQKKIRRLFKNSTPMRKQMGMMPGGMMGPGMMKCMMGHGGMMPGMMEHGVAAPSQGKMQDMPQK